MLLDDMLVEWWWIKMKRGKEKSMRTWYIKMSHDLMLNYYCNNWCGSFSSHNYQHTKTKHKDQVNHSNTHYTHTFIHSFSLKALTSNANLIILSFDTHYHSQKSQKKTLTKLSWPLWNPVPSRESGYTVHLTDLEPEIREEDVVIPPRRRIIIPARLRRMVVKSWEKMVWIIRKIDRRIVWNTAWNESEWVIKTFRWNESYQHSSESYNGLTLFLFGKSDW